MPTPLAPSPGTLTPCCNLNATPKYSPSASLSPTDPVVSVATHPGRTVEKGVEKATEVVTDAAVAVGGAAASAASRSIKHRLQRALGAF